MLRTSLLRLGVGACALALPTALLAPANAAGDVAPVTTAFERTATYPVYLNVPDGVDPADATVAEISTVSPDGSTLIYTDAAGKRIGFVDISDPANPVGTGTVSLAELGHADDQPTSVAVAGDYVLVVIDETGGDFPNPKGRVDVLRLSDRERVASIDLGGQPDSIAINADGTIAAIAIENQRDEENAAVDGGLPQAPTGFIQTLDLTGDPSTWAATPIRFHDDTGAPLPIVAAAGLDTPEDLEPEYVSINSRGELAVTLQENNGVAIIDLTTREITSVFSAGTVSLDGIDSEKDGVISPTGSITDVPREPDAVGWVDDEHLATANEGDWKGGTRGWTVFDSSGTVVWDAGTDMEELATRYGLHNESRAGKKGPEIEGLAVATMNGTRYAFIASERSNFVAVYNVTDPASPVFVQMLFSTNGPEGILPIPSRNLLAVSSETDDSGALVRSSVNLYELGGNTPLTEQPSIISADDASGHAIGWTALGSLTGDPATSTTLYAASDAALKQGVVYTIDTSDPQLALITQARTVMEAGAPAAIDIEGLDARADGGFWLGVEGATGAENAILRTDADLNVVERIALPEEVSAHIGKWGIEGVDSIIDCDGHELVYVAIQRPLWADPAAKPLVGLEGQSMTRIGRYDTATGEWTWFSFQLEETQASGDWMGLSEITVVDANTVAVIERDKLNGLSAAVKRIIQVTLPDEADVVAGGVNPTTQRVALDVLPLLQGTNGWTQEKLEGFTIAADGQAYAVTDNDGLDDATGETVFLRLGDASGLFTDDGGAACAAEPSPSASPSAEASAGASASPSASAASPSEGPTAQPASTASAGPAPVVTGSLARTGASAALALGGAVALVALGGGALAYERRRRD